ncbi:MAG TPA: anhydro-N-acetylmuramic acid kinase [Verrucomicrobiae bacterium]|nr:anhydro-N-acetylmuramic acid kinase [Verrucomicrobiae bacterium]
MIAVGLMSGTSLDGIDAALVRLQPRGRGYAIELLRFETVAFEPAVLEALRSLLPPSEGGIATVAALHGALGRAFGAAALRVAGEASVDFVASHGQTIWHDGARSTTLQIGDAFAIREAVRASVCYDFRSADCAAGGHGAPLVPYVDALLFADEREDRAAVNIGGIANVTLLPAGGEASAYDTGPGNMLLDAFVRERTQGAQEFDRGGEFALAGRADAELLQAMLGDPYFEQAPPKSTGRERFGVQFLARFGERFGRLSLEDGAATLTALTVAPIAGAVTAARLQSPRVLISGGGAHNAAMLAALRERLPGARVEPSDALGIAGDAKEAIAFAVLGYETLRERAANLPAATGARRRVCLGAVAPYDLRALLARVDAEITG